jgi:hypothetical protein
MPLPDSGQGAATVHSLWRGVEGVDKRVVSPAVELGRKSAQEERFLPYCAASNGMGLGSFQLVAALRTFREVLFPGFFDRIIAGRNV